MTQCACARSVCPLHLVYLVRMYAGTDTTTCVEGDEIPHGELLPVIVGRGR
jgi:hypothetical protein